VRNIWAITLFSLILVFGSFTNLDVREFRVRTVVIDAGHGGKDPGALGKRTREKDIALKVALELGRIIEENTDDVKVLYTRNDDTFVQLEERANIANKNHADLFISIHCNAVKNPNVKGTETFVMGQTTTKGNLAVAQRENSVILLEEDYEERYEGFDPSSPASHIIFSLYQNAYLDNSLNFAQKIETQFKQRVGRTSRGVKQAGFVVLWRTNMPSVLVELGFLTNQAEETYLMDDLGQVYLASGIWRAFRDYKKDLESSN